MRASHRAAMAGVLLLATFGSAVSPGTEGEHVIKARNPAWILNLRQQGYVLDEKEMRSDGQDDTTIAFGTDEELVVLDPGPKSSGICVRAFVIDTRSGVVVRKREWTGSGASIVFATSAGKYAVLAGGTVLYGSGLQDEVARSSHWVSTMSPTGGRFAASTRPVKEEVWITMDAETLAETGTIPRFDANRSSLADHSIARQVLGLQQGPYIEISTVRREPVMFQRAWTNRHPQVGWGEAVPLFVSEDVLVVVSEDRLDVVTIDGQLLFSEPGGWNRGTHVSSSRDGRRMAITQERYKGHWHLLKSEQVTVYDLDTNHPVWTLKHDDRKGAFSGHSAVALSPDGFLLAVNSNGVVKIYRLPGAEAR